MNTQDEKRCGQSVPNQLVSFPVGGKEKRTIFGVTHASDGLTGYIYWNTGALAPVKLHLLYSESWRTWFQLPEQDDEKERSL